MRLVDCGISGQGISEVNRPNSREDAATPGCCRPLNSGEHFTSDFKHNAPHEHTIPRRIHS
jgi:hypothetical protein